MSTIKEPMATSEKAKELAKDFLYRYVAPEITSGGRLIWELATTKQILEYYFDDLIRSLKKEMNRRDEFAKAAMRKCNNCKGTGKGKEMDGHPGSCWKCDGTGHIQIIKALDSSPAV